MHCCLLLFPAARAVLQAGVAAPLNLEHKALGSEFQELCRPAPRSQGSWWPSMDPDLGAALSLREPLFPGHILSHIWPGPQRRGQDKGLAPLSQSGTTPEGPPHLQSAWEEPRKGSEATFFLIYLFM